LCSKYLFLVIEEGSNALIINPCVIQNVYDLYGAKQPIIDIRGVHFPRIVHGVDGKEDIDE